MRKGWILGLVASFADPGRLRGGDGPQRVIQSLSDQPADGDIDSAPSRSPSRRRRLKNVQYGSTRTHEYGRSSTSLDGSTGGGVPLALDRFGDIELFVNDVRFASSVRPPGPGPVSIAA